MVMVGSIRFKIPILFKFVNILSLAKISYGLSFLRHCPTFDI